MNDFNLSKHNVDTTESLNETLRNLHATINVGMNGPSITALFGAIGDSTNEHTSCR